MSSYAIHKGVDKPAAFNGLQSQYLVIFPLGLVASFLLVVALHLCGVGPLLCFACGVTAALVVIYTTFRLNARFGRYGLMKVFASFRRPRRIANGRCVQRLIGGGRA